jgi:prolyl-tRNA editing enzyme YbaK/EbsC (Cys-tRNA(Pro) deacylase)
LSGWPEPVERVAAALRRSGVEAEIEAFQGSTATAEDAAAALGVPSSVIVKTVVVVCEERQLAVLVPGDRRVSLEKIERATGYTRARLARAAEVPALTGFEPGAVPPFPLPGGLRVLLDRSLLTTRRIWAGAGSPRHLLACTPGDLITLAGAEILDAADSGG